MTTTAQLIINVTMGHTEILSHIVKPQVPLSLFRLFS